MMRTTIAGLAVLAGLWGSVIAYGLTDAPCGRIDSLDRQIDRLEWLDDGYPSDEMSTLEAQRATLREVCKR
jgi:hypothetical protein